MREESRHSGSLDKGEACSRDCGTTQRIGDMFIHRTALNASLEEMARVVVCSDCIKSVFAQATLATGEWRDWYKIGELSRFRPVDSREKKRAATPERATRREVFDRAGEVLFGSARGEFQDVGTNACAFTCACCTHEPGSAWRFHVHGGTVVGLCQTAANAFYRHQQDYARDDARWHTCRTYRTEGEARRMLEQAPTREERPRHEQRGSRGNVQGRAMPPTKPAILQRRRSSNGGLGAIAQRDAARWRVRRTQVLLDLQRLGKLRPEEEEELLQLQGS